MLSRKEKKKRKNPAFLWLILKREFYNVFNLGKLSRGGRTRKLRNRITKYTYRKYMQHLLGLAFGYIK